ncbi:MAG: hypothetical protein ACREGH_04445 [Minisyncoccia bacterium]
MAEAEHSDKGGHIDGWFIALVLLVLIVLWIRKGGLAVISKAHLNFGWQHVASSTSPFPFTPNVGELAPKVQTPAAPVGPQGPTAPK